MEIGRLTFNHFDYCIRPMVRFSLGRGARFNLKTEYFVSEYDHMENRMKDLYYYFTKRVLFLILVTKEWN